MEGRQKRNRRVDRSVITTTRETEAGGVQVQGTRENLMSEKLKRRLGKRSWVEPHLESLSEGAGDVVRVEPLLNPPVRGLGRGLPRLPQ